MTLLVDNIRRPTPEDVDFMIENIRDEDINEVRDYNGATIREVLLDTPDMDKNAWVWECKGQVRVIFGVNPIEEYNGVGIVWMLGTKSFDEHKAAFALVCRNVLYSMLDNYSYLFNYASAQNKKSLKWLKWLGFNVKQPEPIGINGAEFCRFEIWNKKCVIQ